MGDAIMLLHGGKIQIAAVIYSTGKILSMHRVLCITIDHLISNSSVTEQNFCSMLGLAVLKGLVKTAWTIA